MMLHHHNLGAGSSKLSSVQWPKILGKRATTKKLINKYFLVWLMLLLYNFDVPEPLPVLEEYQCLQSL